MYFPSLWWLFDFSFLFLIILLPILLLIRLLLIFARISNNLILSISIFLQIYHQFGRTFKESTISFPFWSIFWLPHLWINFLLQNIPIFIFTYIIFFLIIFLVFWILLLLIFPILFVTFIPIFLLLLLLVFITLTLLLTLLIIITTWDTFLHLLSLLVDFIYNLISFGMCTIPSNFVKIA